MTGETIYGKAVRKLRVKANVTLREMAAALDFTPAYLSAVEIGKKPVGDQLLRKSATFFEARGIDSRELQDAADRTRKTVDVEALDEDSRALFAAFARHAGNSESTTFEDLPRFLTEFMKGKPDQ